MSPENDDRLGRRAYHHSQEENPAIVLAVVAVVVLAVGAYILVDRFHLRPAQLVEGSIYLLCAVAAVVAVGWYALTLDKRREANWPHPPLFIGQTKDRKEDRQSHVSQ